MRRRGQAALAAAIAAVAAAGGWGANLAFGDARDRPGNSAVPTSTAVVVRTDLATTTQVSGTLGYAGSYQVIDQLPGGAITALPALGAVIRRGQAVYEVAGSSVPLFYGRRPMWRDVQAGIPAGRDIYEIDANLIALGYTDYGYLTASDSFTPATAAAG